ncbi:hypothetical protein H1R20_g2339, partial [Candolleomyces eurysporus]
MPKGPLWEGRRILPSKNFNINNHLIGVRDLDRHAELRKPWNKAFGTGPLKDYEEMLLSRAGLLASRLEELCDQAAAQGDFNAKVDLAEWASFFAFDFMGDIAFTVDFRLLKDGDVNNFVKDMEDAQRLPTIVQHVPWLARITRATPFISNKMRAFAVDPNFTASPLPIIIANSVLAILAGSDTTSSALATTFYSLLRHPECYKQLQKEIDEVCSEDGGCGDPLPSPDRLAQLPYLNAVVFLPEGTNVQVPPYVLHRDPSASASSSSDSKSQGRSSSSEESDSASVSSSDAEDSPSGATTGTSVVHEKNAFIPFSTGPANCAGKPLALMELRYVIALLVRKFDLDFQEDFDVEGWENTLTDRLTMCRGPLLVNLRKRKVVS